MASTWQLVDALTAPVRDDVVALLAKAERAARDEALTEDQRERFDRNANVTHALRRDDAGTVNGYAIVAPGDPRRAEPVLGTFDLALAATLESLAGATSLLLRPVDAELTTTMTARGWHPTREVHRLCMPLPAAAPPATDLVVRSFRPGLDDEAWVAQNNAAFKGHPTQGDMTVERLRSRTSEPWFDPAGFLLFFDGEELVASCWTKIHACIDGDVGEIYVISVSPAAQGRGLGRLAVLEGLRHLASKGLTIAELFVEESNRGAYELYRSVGFRFDSSVVEFTYGALG